MFIGDLILKTNKKSIIDCLTTYGTSCVFSADQDLDNDDSNSWIIDLGHPRLGMSQSYYVTTNADDLEKYKNAYVNYIKTFSKYYRSQYDEVDASDEAIDAMAEKIYEFERQIATNQVICVNFIQGPDLGPFTIDWKLIELFQWTNVENRDPANRTYKKPLEEVETNGLVSDWSQFLNDMFASFEIAGIDTTGDTIVNNSDRKWFAAVDKAIEAAEMSDDDIMDYVAWKVHLSVISYLGDDWRATADEFNEIISGDYCADLHIFTYFL